MRSYQKRKASGGTLELLVQCFHAVSVVTQHVQSGGCVCVWWLSSQVACQRLRFCEPLLRVTYLDVSNQELCWRFHRRFGINDLLDGTGPMHGLVEMLGVQPVTVLPPVHCDAPVA